MCTHVCIYIYIYICVLCHFGLSSQLLELSRACSARDGVANARGGRCYHYFDY